MVHDGYEGYYGREATAHSNTMAVKPTKAKVSTQPTAPIFDAKEVKAKMNFKLHYGI